MLIAHVIDTYDMCQQKRLIIENKNKIKLMHEFSLFVKLDEKFRDEKYLYIVK